ncbi:MAG: hypothetical protein IJO33_02700 [Bacilli bacterium]|nr:hypothetical protein [Bacilli bacterium]
MYEVQKVNEILVQTLEQKEQLLRAKTLKERIEATNKTIQLYDEFVSEAELKLSESLSKEDREKLNYLKDCLFCFISTLKEDQKEFLEIKNKLKYSSGEDIAQRFSYGQNLLRFQDICQKLKYIEFNSKKISKKLDSSNFILTTTAEGRKKSIYKKDIEEYNKLVIEKIKLNKLLKKQYKDVIKGYEKELLFREKYVETIETINVIEDIDQNPKKQEKTLPGKEQTEYTIPYFHQNVNKDYWVKTKQRFKTFIINELKINYPTAINKFLEYYDEGLKFNIDFKMDLYQKGLSSAEIDYIVNKYDNGPKPEGINDNLKELFYKSDELDNNLVSEGVLPVEEKKSRKIVNFFKKKKSEMDIKKIKSSLKKTTPLIVATILSISSSYYAAKSISNIFEKPQKSTEMNIETKSNLTESVIVPPETSTTVISENVTNQNVKIFSNTFYVNENAFIYNNMFDAYYGNNKIEPYYNNNVNRSIKAVIIKLYNNELFYVTDDDQYNYYISQGGIPVVVLSNIDGYTEGFYKFEETSLFGKGMIR